MTARYDNKTTQRSEPPTFSSALVESKISPATDAGAKRTDTTLLITTSGPEKIPREAISHLEDLHLAVLDFSGSWHEGSCPTNWRRLRIGDYLDQEAVWSDFLQFLEDWPRQRLVNGKSFDEVFRRDRGYSLWWTSIGVLRVPNRAGIFQKFQAIWLFDRVLKALAPQRVLIHAKDSELAAALASRLHGDDAKCEFLQGSAKPEELTWKNGFVRVVRSLVRLPVLPTRMVLRALVARMFGPKPRLQHRGENQSAVAFVSRATRSVRIDDSDVTPWSWQEVCQEMVASNSELQPYFLIHKWEDLAGQRRIAGLYHTVWPNLRNSRSNYLNTDRHPAVGAWARAIPTHIANLWRYSRWERSRAFRDSFRFSGADVSHIVVPRLRTAIEGSAYWAQLVGATKKCLQSVPGLRAVMISEAMYPIGTRDVAAARELGIPTIGVQHGAIMPSHLVYRVPQGLLREGLTPDFYAVFGEFAKDVLSKSGHFPANRVWVTGSSRFDQLVTAPKQSIEARRELGLSPDKFVILVATQTFSWFDKALKAIFEVTKDRQDCVVCIKKHPKQTALPLDEVRKLAEAVGAKNVQYFNDQLDTLLAACDVLISSSSTTILEGTLLGRRTICINLSGDPDDYPYVTEGVSLPARSIAELNSALEHSLSAGMTDAENRRQEFLLRHLGPTVDGRAAVTLADRVLALCKTRSQLDSLNDAIRQTAGASSDVNAHSA